MASKAEAGGAARRRRNARELPDSPNPIDIAMAAVASGKPLPDVARRLLEEQADLLHAQRVELRMRHVGEVVRAALWATLAVAAFAIIALIGTLLVRAARTDALIVQSFRVPPALDAKGLTGEVVATQVLDKLAEMQAATRSSRAASAYANNWEDDLKIDIPNTGATTDQIWQLLRGWLGKETRISGEIVDAGAGLALTARVGSEPGHRFASEAGNLDALVTKGAESIFKSTQPYRYAIYLGRSGRADEQSAELKQLAADPSPIERKWAFNGLAYDSMSRGRFREALIMAGRALELDRNMIPALNNAASSHLSLGHTQQMVDLYRRAGALPTGKEFDPVQVESTRCGNGIPVGLATYDPVELDRTTQCLQTSAIGYNEFSEVPRMLAAFVRHDLASALSFRMTPSSEISVEAVETNVAYSRLYAQLANGPSPALSTALDAFHWASSNQTDPRARAELPTGPWQLEAEALAMLGRVPEAQALIARTPLDCYDCVRTRGLVAARANQPRAAQRWFAEAVRQGPRLPSAYVDWGRLLAQHKSFGGAEARFAKAANLSPNWADPLKYWGDALAAQGKRREALVKYEAALKLAPKWQQLKAARARVAG